MLSSSFHLQRIGFSDGGRAVIARLPTMLATVLMLLAGAGVARPSAAPRAIAGGYSIRIAGSYTGTGRAAVTPATITVTARVTNESGETGTLVARNLPLTKGRFSGTGSILGVRTKVFGRLDAPDGKVVKVARLTCTLIDTNGRGARVVGHRIAP